MTRSADSPFRFDDPAEFIAAGDRVVQVPAGLHDPRDLFDAFDAALDFPAYFGSNWDALEECLRDLSWLAERRVVVWHADLPFEDESANRQTYLDVLREVLLARREDGRTPELIVLLPPPRRALVYDASHRAASDRPANERPANERIAFFVNVCQTHDQSLWSAFQVGTGKHAADSTVRLCRSFDGGASWSELPAKFVTHWDGVPGSLSAPALVEPEPGRLLLFVTWFDRSDPQRPLFDPATEGLLRSRQLLAESHDAGRSWSPWRLVPTPGLTGCALTGPVLRWSDGTLALAFESFKEFDDPAPARHGSWLLVSRDGGRTFSPPLLVAQHPEHDTATGPIYYWDQRLSATSRPGEFVALFWTHDRRRQQDLNVHWLRSSLDAELPRPLPTMTTLPGQIAAPLWLDEDRVLAFVVDRADPGTLTLWRSADGGATWPVESRYVVHRHRELAKLSQGREQIDFAAYWEDMGKWSFGHPALLRLANHRLLAAWYAGTPDCMSVHCAVIDV